MRNMLLGLAMILIPTAALGQLVALPTASSSAAQQASLTWVSNTPGTGQVACGTANPCTFEVFRCQGAATACPATGSVWTLVNTTAANVFVYKDNPGVGTWSYVVVPYLVSTGTTSGPSNVVTLTLTNPQLPAPVTASGTAG